MSEYKNPSSSSAPLLNQGGRYHEIKGGSGGGGGTTSIYIGCRLWVWGLQEFRDSKGLGVTYGCMYGYDGESHGKELGKRDGH